MQHALEGSQSAVAVTLELYQEPAVDWLAHTKRGIVVSPAGSGKTIIAAGALDRVLMRIPRLIKPKVGWMANTIDQCGQAQAAIDKFPKLKAGCDFLIKCAAAQSDWSDFDVLVCDEAHHAPAGTWEMQIASCLGARWAFTATPPDGEQPERRKIFLELFEHRLYFIDRASVASRVVPGVVHMLADTDDNLAGDIDREIERQMKRAIKYGKREEWHAKMTSTLVACNEIGIVRNRRRNDAAVLRAIEHVNAGASVIVLVNSIEHGQQLAARIPGAVCCYAAMGKTARTETLEAFKSGSVKCVVATSILDEGFDAPIASVLVLVSAGSSKAKTEQRTGRVLRRFQEKTHGIVYDFFDRQHPTMENHAKKRMRVYRKLGYQIL